VTRRRQGQPKEKRTSTPSRIRRENGNNKNKSLESARTRSERFRLDAVQGRPVVRGGEEKKMRKKNYLKDSATEKKTRDPTVELKKKGGSPLGFCVSRGPIRDFLSFHRSVRSDRLVPGIFFYRVLDVRSDFLCSTGLVVTINTHTQRHRCYAQAETVHIKFLNGFLGGGAGGRGLGRRALSLGALLKAKPRSSETERE